MRIALFGVGHWHSAMHLDAAQAARADVVGVWDENPDVAAGFARAHGQTHLPTIEAGLAQAPDVVVLMGHPATLPAQAERLIAAKVPLILEKPVGDTDTIARLADQARAGGCHVAVPLANRFGPAQGELARLAEISRAGRLVRAGFRLVNGPPQRYRDDGVGWLLDPAVGGGGALRNLGIHGIDAALDLAEGPLTILSSSVGKLIHATEVEDHALVVMRDAAGTLFTVEAGYTFASMRPGGEFEWRLVSANATLTDLGDSATVATLDDNQMRNLRPEPTATRYRLFMADALARLGQGRPPAVSLDDYLAAMRLIDAAYLAAGRNTDGTIATTPGKDKT